MVWIVPMMHERVHALTIPLVQQSIRRHLGLLFGIKISKICWANVHIFINRKAEERLNREYE